MATPARPQPAPSVAAILDQLDELEALMQRMLSLPVGPSEAEEEHLERAAGFIPAEPATGPSPAARQPDPEPAGLAWDGVAQEVTGRNEEQDRDETRGKQQSVSAGRAPSPVLPVPVPPATPVQAGKAAPQPMDLSPAIWLRPLLKLEDAFRRGVTPLGGLGRFLLTDAGRMGLGVLGLLLLAGAVAWGIWDWSANRSAAPLAPARSGR